MIEMEDKNITGIILAGGKSSRLGRDKARETIGNVPLIQRVVMALAEVSSEIIVVGSKLTNLTEINGVNIRTVKDRASNRGPLMGIYSGLSQASYPYACLVACDLPFLDPAVLKLLIELAPGRQAVVPLIQEIPQPTHAIYARSILPHIEEALKTEGGGLRTLLDNLEVKYVAEAQIREIDRDLRSFMNINTEDDLKEARRIYKTYRLST